MVWKKCVSFFATALVFITLCSAQAAIGQEASNGVWTDAATGLVWAVKDNGADINWNQAREHCAALRLGDHSDWRLPTVDELEALYDKSVSKPYRIKGPIQLGGPCTLSATLNNSGEAWSFCFSYGGRSLGRVTGHGSAGRALCVRGPSQ